MRNASGQNYRNSSFYDGLGYWADTTFHRRYFSYIIEFELNYQYQHLGLYADIRNSNTIIKNTFLIPGIHLLISELQLGLYNWNS